MLWALTAWSEQFINCCRFLSTVIPMDISQLVCTYGIQCTKEGTQTHAIRIFTTVLHAVTVKEKLWVKYPRHSLPILIDWQSIFGTSCPWLRQIHYSTSNVSGWMDSRHLSGDSRGSAWGITRTHAGCTHFPAVICTDVGKKSQLSKRSINNFA